MRVFLLGLIFLLLLVGLATTRVAVAQPELPTPTAFVLVTATPELPTPTPLPEVATVLATMSARDAQVAQLQLFATVAVLGVLAFILAVLLVGRRG